MALKIALRPHEKIIIAGAAITNGSCSTSLIIENNVPVLREKDILKEENADSPARRIYFVVQLMYMDQENLALHHQSYWVLVRDFLRAAPSSLGLIDKINVQILSAQYYTALKSVRKLIEYEQSIISGAGES
jgi:flagellar protein FlbT